jgi:hypothetical protein
VARRGASRQANLARFLALRIVEGMDDERAKAVGVLAGKSSHDDIVDVDVVEGAIGRRDAIATSNPTHIHAIADAARVRLRIETIRPQRRRARTPWASHTCVGRDGSPRRRMV